MLACHKERRNFSNAELSSGPDHKEVCVGKLVLIDGAAKHVVLQRLHCLAG